MMIPDLRLLIRTGHAHSALVNLTLFDFQIPEISEINKKRRATKQHLLLWSAIPGELGIKNYDF